MVLGGIWWHLLVLVAGTIALWIGAEALVKGAGGLAFGLGLRAATVGVTVIAFATTAPELVVATLGSLAVSTDIGLGAIVGSNVANIGLVIGLAALIRPLPVTDTVLKRHVPFMILAAVLLVVLGLDGSIGRIEGAVMLLVLAGFSLFVLHYVSADPTKTRREHRQRGIDRRDALLVVVGLIVLVVGSRWLIDGGRGVLVAFGFSDLFIGLTVLALGTSFPELAASVVGAIRDETDFAVGNVVGSNIYNILAVIGIVTLIVPIGVSPDVLRFELPALVVFTAVLTGMMYYGRTITRLDGAILVVGYVAFIWLLLP